jgi:hypothetical protein
MNTINKILGKDISSIIFKYLTVNKDTIKMEYFKNLSYLNAVFDYENFSGDKLTPSRFEIDNKQIFMNYKWDENRGWC